LCFIRVFEQQFTFLFGRPTPFADVSSLQDVCLDWAAISLGSLILKSHRLQFCGIKKTLKLSQHVKAADYGEGFLSASYPLPNVTNLTSSSPTSATQFGLHVRRSPYFPEVVIFVTIDKEFCILGSRRCVADFNICGCRERVCSRNFMIHLVPRSKNAWSYTSTAPVSLHGVLS